MMYVCVCGVVMMYVCVCVWSDDDVCVCGVVMM